jgi:sulfite exporter TauE/SafE
MDYWTAFVLGFFGSLHCAGMCGPLALALPQAGNSRATYVIGRWLYNLGRVLTYGALGVVFGTFGKVLVLAGVQRAASIGLGILLLTGLFASRKWAAWAPITPLVNHLKSKMAALFRKRSLPSLMALGSLNGLLPCGLVYVACAGAATTGAVLSAMTYMAAFGAGTLPMMLAISLSGKLVPISLRLKLARAIPVSVFLLATLLILRGMALGIPYVSPDLSHSSCCSK